MDEHSTKSTDTYRMMICPGCEKEIKVLNEYLGLRIECTLCGKRFRARILDDEKRRSKRAEHAGAAHKMAEAMKAAASQQQRRQVDSDNRILEGAAHGDLRGHVVPVGGVEDLLDSPEARASEPEPARETNGEREFHLITIRGKPLWIGATLAVMALSVVTYLATRPDRDPVPGVASPPLRPIATATPTTETTATGAQQPQDETQPYHGLGFSLAQIEAAWGIDAGWYWREKKQAESGIGIRYTAGHVSLPRVNYIVTGLPDNVSTISVTFITPLKRWEKEDRELFYGAPTIMVSKITDCSAKDLVEWISSIMEVFEDEKLFGSESDVRTCGEYLIAATVSVYDEVAIAITVKANVDP